MDGEVDPNSTTGIWIGEDDVQLFEEFDAYFQAHGQGTYSRGERIKRAMRVYLAAHEAARSDDELPHPDEMRTREFAAMVDSEIRYDEVG